MSFIRGIDSSILDAPAAKVCLKDVLHEDGEDKFDSGSPSHLAN
jgi:hypothetical protein